MRGKLFSIAKLNCVHANHIVVPWHARTRSRNPGGRRHSPYPPWRQLAIGSCRPEQMHRMRQRILSGSAYASGVFRTLLQNSLGSGALRSSSQSNKKSKKQLYFYHIPAKEQAHGAALQIACVCLSLATHLLGVLARL